MPVDVPWWIYPLVGAVLFAAACVWGYMQYRQYRFRKANQVAIANIAYEILRDVLVPNGNGGFIHLNYVLLTQRGLLVLDLLDLPGAIFGGDQMIEWTAIGRKRRYTFPNPQHALYDRMAALKLLSGEVPVDGRVVFTTRSEFPKGRPRNVLRIDDLPHQFPPVDRSRGNITAAFGDVWANVKKNSEPNPLAA